MKIEENDLEFTIVSKAIESGKTRQLKRDQAKEMRTGHVEEVERELGEKGILDMTPTGSGAAKPGARSEIEVLKSASEKQHFIRGSSFNDFEDEYELVAGSFLTEK